MIPIDLNVPKLELITKAYNWSEILASSDVDEKVDNFYKHLYSILDRFVPKKRYKQKRSRYCMSPDLGRLRNRRRAAGRQAARHNNENNRNYYQTLNNAFIKHINREYNQHLQYI